MAALQAANVACILHPTLARRLKDKASCSSCNTFDQTCNSLRPSYSLRCLPLRIFSDGPIRRLCIRNKTFQAVSFQDVAENESDGNDSTTASSSPIRRALTDLSNWHQREKKWQYFQLSFQDWAKNLKNSQITEENLKNHSTRIQQQSPSRSLVGKVYPAKTWWQHADPSIKWSLIIFVPMFLAVTLFCGPAVSKELYPLWVLGPLSTIFWIRTAIKSFRLCDKYVAPYCSLAVQRSIGLVQDLRSGKVQEDLKNQRERLIKGLANKRADMENYLRTNAASDFKAMIVRCATWVIEKYEDMIDWLWPSWRLLWRLVQNLF